MASQTTRDHDQIRRWAQTRGATPSVVSRTGGMLRFEFAANPPGELADVAWADFFHVFDERDLELAYDDKPGSRFHKLVYPETMAGKTPARRPTRAKIQSIASRAKAKPAARSPQAKPRLTRTGSKAAAKKSPSRRPKAA